MATLLGGCADDLGSVARQHGVATPAIVRLSDEFAVAARRAGDGVEVVAFTGLGDRWSAEIIAFDSGGEVTARLVTMGGTSGQEWNSFFFGTAPDAASRVVVDGFAGTGGQVADTAWVVAFRERDLSPHRLHWTVLDALGDVIASGTGITP
ncbi:MAG: hypothetical protein ABIZ57_11545 [Candidatus Limnocylindria bacterium]